jgi:hypothetical protein
MPPLSHPIQFLFVALAGWINCIHPYAFDMRRRSCRAPDHFETAIRQADTLPHRLLQPTARYWYGRLLVDEPHSAERARGRAMIEAAATDFRTLEMVTYANLAERFLRH